MESFEIGKTTKLDLCYKYLTVKQRHEQARRRRRQLQRTRRPTRTKESTTTTTNTRTSSERTGSGYPRRRRRGWPGGRHANPTELKMRSTMIAFSVNFAPFPASSILRSPAKSMRPRAKSFIRPISQIEYNRQKFSISMTSEVRNAPNRPKVTKNRDFGTLWNLPSSHTTDFFPMYKKKLRHDETFTWLKYCWHHHASKTFIFEKNQFFFTFFHNFSDLPLDCGIGWWRWFFFRPYLGHLSG